MIKYGELMRSLRLNKKYTLEELVTALEKHQIFITHSHITAIEFGRAYPSPPVVVALAKVFKDSLGAYDMKKLVEMVKEEKLAQKKDTLDKQYNIEDLLREEAKENE